MKPKYKENIDDLKSIPRKSEIGQFQVLIKKKKKIGRQQRHQLLEENDTRKIVFLVNIKVYC